jgi:hypothetical protein
MGYNKRVGKRQNSISPEPQLLLVDQNRLGADMTFPPFPQGGAQP